MPKILWIEHQTVERKIYSSALGREGVSVQGAKDGEEGMKKIISFEPDLVLYDMDLSKKEGFELLAELRRASLRVANTPFFFLCPAVDRDFVVEGLKAGADACLTKPVNFDYLLVMLQTRMHRFENNKSDYLYRVSNAS